MLSLTIICQDYHYWQYYKITYKLGNICYHQQLFVKTIITGNISGLSIS